MGENSIQTPEERIQSIHDVEKSVKSMEDFTSPEVLYRELISSVKKYHPSDSVHMIEKAYEIASKAHEGQVRKSGEPYIIHPLCVAIILADLELDKETIVAGILHDVVEDTVMTEEELTELFGSEVALLVDGVTKLGQLNYSSDKLEVQAENLRKMFLAMAKDIRVILIKLADRLHNMRTLKYMPERKQKEKARETMDIYAPIAQRLGISKVKVELDDLSLKYLKPEVYYDLVDKIAVRKSEREKFIHEIVDEVKSHMVKAKIDAQVDGRVKHFFSIYKKMVNQDKTLDQIYDLFAVRIIVPTLPGSCSLSRSRQAPRGGLTSPAGSFTEATMPCGVFSAEMYLNTSSETTVAPAKSPSCLGVQIIFTISPPAAMHSRTGFIPSTRYSPYCLRNFLSDSEANFLTSGLEREVIIIYVLKGSCQNVNYPVKN